MSKNFRYDISFLRVVAVISVILFHYDFSFFNGGFVGVDTFFVISGYLMTKIILTGFEKNNFNLVEFYNTYFDLQNLPIEKVSTEEKPYIYDSDHLSYYGTEQYKAYIKKEIQNYLKAK